MSHNHSYFWYPFDEDEKPSAKPRTKMTLRDRPQTITTADTAENKGNDKSEEEEEESSESKDNWKKLQKQDKNFIKESRHHKAKQILQLDHTS